MSWGRDVGRVLFDPANVTGLFNESGAPEGPDTVPSFWNGPEGFAYGLPGKVADTVNQYNQGQKAHGYFESMGAQPGTGITKAFDPNRHIAPPDFSSQWQYQAGKGPQWVEPTRVSSDNKVPWAATVNNGPAKGNRF